MIHDQAESGGYSVYICARCLCWVRWPSGSARQKPVALAIRHSIIVWCQSPPPPPPPPTDIQSSFGQKTLPPPQRTAGNCLAILSPLPRRAVALGFTDLQSPVIVHKHLSCSLSLALSLSHRPPHTLSLTHSLTLSLSLSLSLSLALSLSLSLAQQQHSPAAHKV